MIGVDPRVWPNLHGFARFVEGEVMNMKNAMNSTHKSKGKLTHTRYTPVVLIGLIHQLNIESQGRDSKSRIPCERLTCKG
jgi:hypothetical protein